MKVVIDAATLLLFLSPEARIPNDPATGLGVTQARERVEYLVAELEKRRATVVIPAPALSEALVFAGTAAMVEYTMRIESAAVFRIAAFETKAAIELAIMTSDALLAGDKRGGIDAPWTKVKYDRQIIAIAKVEGASRIYTDDGGIHHFATQAGIPCTRLHELVLPPEDSQMALPLNPPAPAGTEPPETSEG